MLCVYPLYPARDANNASIAGDSDATETMQIQVQNSGQKQKKVPLSLVVIGDCDHDLQTLVARLQADLQWTEQCQVTVAAVAHLKAEKDLKDVCGSDAAFAILISKSKKKYSCRLYDLFSMQMVVGQEFAQADISVSMLAHTIADMLWPQLFGQEGSFRSKIAYSKRIWKTKYGRDRSYAQIWVADFDGSNAQLFINAPTVNFASRWSVDPQVPLLFYSENTISNVQLVMSNMFGKTRAVCSFDGLNMQPTFSKDGQRVVFCLSKDGTSQLYLSYIDTVSKQRKFERLTFNSGENIAPCFVDDTHVVFVSDFKTNKPQIFMLDLKSKYVTQITDGGYCACPSYSAVRNQIVYSKMMDRQMQLFVYDLTTKQHSQITFSPGSKEEGSWSACGNYIIFGINSGSSSRIAQLYLPTKSIKFLTSDQDHCTYPDCSPIYQNMLGILSK